MDDQNQNSGSSAPMPVVSKGGRSGIKLALTVLAALSVLFLAGAGYLYWQLQDVKDKERQLNQTRQQLEQQIKQLRQEGSGEQSAAAEPDAQACNDTPSEDLRTNIKAALDSKNTASFDTYTTDPVRYVLAASEFGGEISAAEAASSLSYTHSATGPWDFNLPAATVAGYDAGFYTDYFDDNTYVGKAASGMVAAFDFGCDGKVNQIFITPDESTLTSY